MTVFATSPDWAAGITERIGYLTDILRAHDDTEQRIRLRSTANGGLAFRALCADAQEAAAIEAMLWANQAAAFLVPWWPDVSPLTVAADAPDTVLQVDTTDRDFVQGGAALVWLDHLTYAEVLIDSLTASTITLDSAIGTEFPLGAVVVPLKEGRLEDQQSVGRPTGSVSELDVSFTTEPGEVPAYSGSAPTQYEGYDLIEELPNNRLDGEIELRRASAMIDSRTSIRVVDDKSGIATALSGFNWFAYTRSEIAALKRFIHRRFGQAVPFWLPTWHNDLPLAEDAAGAAVNIDIKRVGYTDYQFPDTARRHIAFIDPSGAITARKVTAAVDNGDGTETITVSSALPAGGFPAATMVSFLPLVRLADDDVDLRWSSPIMVECDLPVVEVTREVPA